MEPATTRANRSDIIENNDEMLIKYATAIRVGTATTEAILRRFTRNASHPVYQAMLEVGRAQKTIFLARYLRDRDLQHEIEAGLNVVENCNNGNDAICFGSAGEFTTNRRDQQERAMLALQLRGQSAWSVVMEPERGLEGRDQTGPFLLVGERAAI